MAFHSPFWQQDSFRPQSEQPERKIAASHYRANLTAMTWQNFERIRELFDEEFSVRGAGASRSQEPLQMPIKWSGCNDARAHEPAEKIVGAWRFEL